MRYIVTNSAGANLRPHPSSTYSSIVKHVDKFTQINVISDWKAINASGSSTTTYLPVAIDGGVAYVSDALVEPANIVTVDGDKVRLNGRTTKVLNQHTRPEGRWKTELYKHGCGACSARVVLNLNGCALTPEDVMNKAFSLFGSKLSGEHYGLSARGMAAVAMAYGVKATALPVTKATLAERGRDIDAALKAGHPVCCWLNPSHWICCVGYNVAGKIVIADSAGDSRVRYTNLPTLISKLYTTTATSALKAQEWLTSTSASCGIVIIG